MAAPKTLGRRAGKAIPNHARAKPITENQAKAVADGQIWLREFNPDYDQVVKRISAAPTGLRNGAPPPPVS